MTPEWGWGSIRVTDGRRKNVALGEREEETQKKGAGKADSPLSEAVPTAQNVWSCTYCSKCRYLWLPAAAAKSLQSCPTLCDPIESSPPGSPVPRILQAEHWSGLPFPSPMHESEKWKGSRSVESDSQRPSGLQPTRLLRPWDFPGKSTRVGCHCLLRVTT